MPTGRDFPTCRNALRRASCRIVVESAIADTQVVDMEHLAWPLHPTAPSNAAAARFVASLCASPAPQGAVALSEQASLVSGSSTPRANGKRAAESPPLQLAHPRSGAGGGPPPKCARTNGVGVGMGGTETSVASDSGAGGEGGVGVATLSASQSASMGNSLGTSLGTSFGDVSGLSNSPGKSHTRRCREKVNEKFARLLEALPAAPNGVEVKHKAQILEYAIRVFRALLARRQALRVDIALASPASLARWATQRPIHAFVSLYARKHHWPYAETWRWHYNTTNAHSHSVSLEAVHAEPYANQLRALAPLATAAIARGMCGVIARVAASRRAEWLPLVGADPVALARAEAAVAVGVRQVLAVPVVTTCTTGKSSKSGVSASATTNPTTPDTITHTHTGPIITESGNVLAVILFMDRQCRPYDTRTVEEATEFASIVADTHIRTCRPSSSPDHQDPTAPAVAVV